MGRSFSDFPKSIPNLYKTKRTKRMKIWKSTIRFVEKKENLDIETLKAYALQFANYMHLLQL